MRKTRKNKSKVGKSAKGGSPVISIPTRNIPQTTRILLFVRAGGRCQFDGCNKYLLEHHLTLSEGNFSQMAHIVAFSKEGPRGGINPHRTRVNDVDNLMLLCPQCHKLIDNHPDQYTVSTLEKYKRKHEERIHHVTGLGPELKTTVVQLKTKVAGQQVGIPITQVTEAVSPRYPTDARGYIIDLTNIDDRDAGFMDAAMQEIRRKIERLYEPGMDVAETRHISLFALAPIPLLIFLGRQLSNKIPVDAYQRHRDTENWVWKTVGEPVEYKFHKLKSGQNPKNVAMILSLSGKIHLDSLLQEVDDSYSVYEITLAGVEPNPGFLRLRQDLTNFKETYQASLRSILRDHGDLEKVHFFPAVPAPVAVLCGKELLPKVDPKLLVYDYDKSKGGFNLITEVN
jgi:5-methylcytosine-specific restriction endonuclease McrA